MNIHNNDIYIVGAGAIGIALAVQLAREKRRAILVRTTEDEISEKSHEFFLHENIGEVRNIGLPVISLNLLERLVPCRNYNEIICK